MKRSTLEISKTIGTDHRTVKKFANKPELCNGRSDKGKLRKSTRVSHRALNLIKREASRNPLQSSKEVFKDAGVSGIPKTSRCRILKTGQMCHKKKLLEWAQKYMRLPFEYVLFTDECRASLNGPDGWRRGWFSAEHGRPHLLRCQQGGGSVMFWAGIVGNELVGPFRVEDGVKMTAIVHIDFLKKNFVPWHKSKNLAFRKNFVFIACSTAYH